MIPVLMLMANCIVQRPDKVNLGIDLHQEDSVFPAKLRGENNPRWSGNHYPEVELFPLSSNCHHNIPGQGLLGMKK